MISQDRRIVKIKNCHINMKLKHPCSFTHGTAVFDNPKNFRDECRALDGKQGFITLSQKTKRKSNQQQRYYFGVIVKMIAEYCGYDDLQEAHAAISYHFLRVKRGGLVFVRSTALLKWTTAEWSEYVDKVVRWAAETFGLVIPSPDEISMDSLPDYYGI